MRVAALDEVDWTAPWLAPYRDAGRRVAEAVESHGSVAAALNAELEARCRRGAGPLLLAAGRLCFVAQSDLPAGCGYESFIASTARVPTRDNLHDLFNGLVWLHWPQLKRHLNELQVAAPDVLPATGRRGAVRDALTLFDENAALLRLPPLLEQALRDRDWQAAFVAHRTLWCEAEVCLIGHALMEKLVRPRKAITAHGWLLPQGLVGPDSVQSWLVDHLTPTRLAARGHLPLPVLGVPGWWPANEDPGYYADRTVFRPLRNREAAAIIPR